ncbi:CinA family protein [Psychromonas aquatilis]|uniref:CinA family protein n=1 Tax=Psychromonas aquatilis TaxID=2005072 RepID=A0ABU9GMV1_9GAMM
MFPEKTVTELAQVLGQKLTQAGLVLCTAESCTGGGVAYAITEISGSSQWFDRSFITYSNNAKNEMLDVDLDLINEFGAVSKEVVNAMATGAVKNSNADISVAISGIAGPNGGSQEKPVGTVCIAWYYGQHKCKSETFLFTGDRAKIRLRAIKATLLGLLKELE